MSMTMGDRVSAARRRGFVGRATELELFAAALRSPELPVAVLFVHGPPGVGKTSLLRRYGDICEQSGVTCVRLDARDLPPVATALEAALAPLVGSLVGSLAGPPQTRSSDAPETARTVVLLDTYELLGELDGWVRQELLPRLPADTLVVLGGQHGPSPGWRTDPGWAELVQAVPLGNLSAQESSTYLSVRRVSEAAQPAVLEFTRGNPLALALVSEVLRNEGTFAPRESPDVIKVLVDRLVQVVPSPAHRRALEASAQVRVTTEPLLAALLDLSDASELFAWMRDLPFVESGPAGLHLHDLARDVLAADLQWRHPDLYVQLHDRARSHYLTRLEQAGSAEQAALLLDLVFMHAELRPFLRPPEPAGPGGGLRVEPARGTDSDAIRHMVARHEGEASARLAVYWLERQPQAWQVVRGQTDEPVGLLCQLALADTTSADRDADPAVAAAHRQLRNQAPLRPGERATLFRFWMDSQSYQDISPVQSLIAMHMGRHYLTTSALAVTLLAFAEPDRWVEFCAYADQVRTPDADFVVGGSRYGVYGHDWRVVTPAAWLAMLSRREVGTQPASPVIADGAPRLLVLDRPEFAAAVKQALRFVTRPDRLRDNPLLASRLVTSRTGDGASTKERVAALQAAIGDAAATLKATPADQRLHRVLHRAHLSPAPNLERAAELLDLPSSTFRRQLTTAVDRVVTILWDKELGA